MTALWVLLGIIVFFAVLLSFSVTLYVTIREEIKIAVGAFGYRYKLDFDGEKLEKPPKKKKEKRPAPAAEKKPPKKPDKRSLGDTVEFILLLLRSILPGTGRLLQRLRFTAVRIDMTVAEDMADETAIQYGAVSAGVYTLLGALDSLFTLRVKAVDILPDFVSGEPVYDISFKVKLRLGSILAAAFGIFFKLVGNTIRAKKAVPPSAEPARQE